jgi:hypothetical protein
MRDDLWVLTWRIVKRPMIARKKIAIKSYSDHDSNDFDSTSNSDNEASRARVRMYLLTSPTGLG